MVFSIFSAVQPLSQLTSEYFITHKYRLAITPHLPPFKHTQPQATNNLLSVSMDLPDLDISHK